MCRPICSSCETETYRTRIPEKISQALPSSIQGVGWSDQWSFWQQGYQALMITDTAPFRYPYYHTWEDTVDKIDFDKLSRVTYGLSKVIRDFVGLAG